MATQQCFTRHSGPNLLLQPGWVVAFTHCGLLDGMNGAVGVQAESTSMTRASCTLLEGYLPSSMGDLHWELDSLTSLLPGVCISIM